MKTRTAALLALLLLVEGKAALAADFCGNSPLNAAQSATCASDEADQAEKRVFEAYQHALAAARTAHDQCGLTIDFVPDIDATQDLWKLWNDKECALETAVTMGQGAVIAGAICRQRLANDQSKALSDMAEHFRCRSAQKP